MFSFFLKGANLRGSSEEFATRAGRDEWLVMPPPLIDFAV
jgi:hypothetical protein